MEICVVSVATGNYTAKCTVDTSATDRADTFYNIIISLKNQCEGDGIIISK